MGVVLRVDCGASWRCRVALLRILPFGEQYRGYPLLIN